MPQRLLLPERYLQGNVLQKDAAPVQWEGNRFSVSKERTSDDHFFGLGDKPGPLDRGGRAFTMWNTDAFGWQESTDPIRDLMSGTWRSEFNNLSTVVRFMGSGIAPARVPVRIRA